MKSPKAEVLRITRAYEQRSIRSNTTGTRLVHSSPFLLFTGRVSSASKISKIHRLFISGACSFVWNERGGKHTHTHRHTDTHKKKQQRGMHGINPNVHSYCIFSEKCKKQKQQQQQKVFVFNPRGYRRDLFLKAVSPTQTSTRAFQ